METENNINITLVKKVSKVIFEQKNDYEIQFAKELARNKFAVSDAYSLAFNDVNKVKASLLLQDPKIWDLYFAELNKKTLLTADEKDNLVLYNDFVDQFEITPFEAFTVFVENWNQLDKPISEIISDNPVNNFMVLCYMYNFFINIDREHFYTKTKERIIIEKDQIELTSKRNNEISVNFAGIKKVLMKKGIRVDLILKGIL